MQLYRQSPPMQKCAGRPRRPLQGGCSPPDGRARLQRVQAVVAARDARMFIARFEDLIRMKTLFALGIAVALSVSAQTQTTAPPPAAPSAKPAIQVTPGADPHSFQVRLAENEPTPITQLPPANVMGA